MLKNPDYFNCNYKHIVVDESQDFSSAQMKQLYEIAVLNDGSLYAFYDKNQYVQGENYFVPTDNDDQGDEPEWLKLMECRLVLRLNCRNTFAIAETAGKTIDVKPKMKDRAVQGDIPSFFICESSHEAKKKLSILIDKYRREGGYSYDSICILTIKSEEESFLYGEEKLGNHKICSARSSSGVFFTSARKFKGLESDIVIIIDVDKNSLGEDGEKRLFYVAASRAKHFLNILFSGSEEEALEMPARLADKQYPKLAATVAVALKARLETS